MGLRLTRKCQHSACNALTGFVASRLHVQAQCLCSCVVQTVLSQRDGRSLSWHSETAVLMMVWLPLCAAGSSQLFQTEV